MLSCYWLNTISAQDNPIYSIETSYDSNSIELNSTGDDDYLNDDQLYNSNYIYPSKNSVIFLSFITKKEEISSNISSIWQPPKL